MGNRNGGLWIWRDIELGMGQGMDERKVQRRVVGIDKFVGMVIRNSSKAYEDFDKDRLDS